MKNPEIKARRILECFRTGYSMGEYRTLQIKDASRFNSNILNKYARSCKYKPKYGSINITLSANEFKSIQFIEGIPTIKGKNNRCKWLQGTGDKGSYRVVWVHGYLIGSSHSSVSVEDARETERKKVNYKALGNKRFVGYNDLRNIGACHAGIMQFCNRFGLNPDFGYSIEYLKEIAPRFNHYFNRL